jgi:mannose-6-phosphate isomerase-like protein (cupin superfamily)
MTMATGTAKQEQKPVGQVLSVVGLQIVMDVTAEQTGGAYVVADTTAPPQIGPPPHVHEREDEAFFVLEGTFEILLGDRTIRASAGEHVFGPRGVAHTFRNVGSGPGRILIIINPAGFERCLEELGQLPPGPPDIANVTAICAKYGCKILATSD